MVAFASLFLALVIGVRPVEVVVGEGVASVELHLDGERIGTLEQAPWALPVDFGSELAPRQLEAIAFDSQQRELGRVSQWLNLPQPQAVTSVVLEPRQPGQPRVAQVSWQSAAGAEPKAVIATFDGEPLTVTDPRRIVLPPADESQLHLLNVELQFDNHVTSRIDLTFGGAYVDEVSTEITALAVRQTGKRRRPPTTAEAQDWFSKGGEPLKVIAIEKETAEVVVVMGRPFPRFIGPGEPYKTPKSLYLGGDQRLRFVFPVPEKAEGVDVTFDLFPVSPPYDGGLGDLYTLLTRIRDQPRDRAPRFTSAAAIAGRVAYEGRHRRAVVLIPSSDSAADESTLAPALVKRYLERLHVPLIVWDPESKSATELAAWGEVRKVGSIKQLVAAFDEISDLLAEQWIVWLDGQHLPQDIELAPSATGFTLKQ
ncbi:MAG: hypothetical protein AAF657_22680 [Acidobacteriota bacterium]